MSLSRGCKSANHTLAGNGLANVHFGWEAEVEAGSVRRIRSIGPHSLPEGFCLLGPGLVEFPRFLLKILRQLNEVFHAGSVPRRIGQLAQVLRTLAQVGGIHDLHPTSER